MRKKRLIIISVILSVFAVMIVLASTVFMLKSASVDIVSANTSVLSASDSDSIIKCAKFNYGGNVLFMNFNKQIERIEKEFAYAKVEKIERKFPNKVVVHISERSPAFYVQTTQYIYVLDNDLKVLNVVAPEDFNESNSSLPQNALLVPKLFDFEIESGTTKGSKLKNDALKSIIQSIITGLKKSDINITQLKSIKTFYEVDEFRLELGIDNNEMTLLIKGAKDLSQKVQVGIQAYNAHISENPSATGKMEQVSATDISFVPQS